MQDTEKVIKDLTDLENIMIAQQEICPKEELQYWIELQESLADALELLKEQEKKRITLHKKHVITWKRNDEFSMRNLYESICETLLDEGELFIARTDDHEKADFVFYVIEGR